MRQNILAFPIMKAFNSMCSKLNITGSILEIGAGPKGALFNLPCIKEAKNIKLKIGIDLKKQQSPADFDLITGNANNMRDLFKNDSFDVVLCNAIFEHDKFFWKSLGEIRRVLKSGGVFVLGVPGYIKNIDLKPINEKTKKRIKVVKKIKDAIITYKVHNCPGDYYRFSTQAYEEVLMEGFKSVTYSTVLIPPRIIGYGIRK